jgi:hypothetical protein
VTCNVLKGCDRRKGSHQAHTTSKVAKVLELGFPDWGVRACCGMEGGGTDEAIGSLGQQNGSVVLCEVCGRNQPRRISARPDSAEAVDDDSAPNLHQFMQPLELTL